LPFLPDLPPYASVPQAFHDDGRTEDFRARRIERGDAEFGIGASAGRVTRSSERDTSYGGRDDDLTLEHG
jgi:hypothetical protein